MRTIYMLTVCAVCGLCATAQNVITLDLKSAIDDGTYKLDADKGYWIETYNASINMLTFNNGMFNFSHMQGQFGGTDMGGGMSYWDGFTICNSGDTNDYGMLGNSDGWVSQQWGCMAGGGLNEDMQPVGGYPYLVAFCGNIYNGENSYSCKVDFDGNIHKVKGVYISNHPWPYYGNIHGDGFASAFSEEGSAFTITAHGLFNGEDTGSEVTMTLAENTGDDEIHGNNWPMGLVQSAEWQWMNLEELGEIDGLYFTLETTDADLLYGPNTAVYFCLDRMQIYESGNTQTPRRPSGLTVTDIGEQKLTLHWNKQDDTQKWIVYLADSVVAETTDTLFIYDHLSPYTDYTLKVVAVNDNGAGDPTSLIVRTIDETAPEAPANVVAEPIGPYSIALSWDAAIDNVAVTRYRVYIDGVQEARPKTCTYTLTGLEPETDYKIAIEAVDASGNVSQQTLVFARTADDPLGVNNVVEAKECPIKVCTIYGKVVMVESLAELPNGIYVINGKTLRIRK